MRAVVAPGDHEHEAPTEIQAELVALGPIGQLALKLPDELQAVLVVSYRPVQAWAKPGAPALTVEFQTWLVGLSACRSGRRSDRLLAGFRSRLVDRAGPPQPSDLPLSFSPQRATGQPAARFLRAPSASMATRTRAGSRRPDGYTS